ncbi:class I tRNA ligase family protein [Burkholderia ubonensis]|uniref:class I tRNA ligase family protein n=1 Tax=Burkholderia ubonensis TaxID=101571 RepID=UPI000BA577C7|nr:class I tRNA ligase family protein [Burkholderia ubonensis]PAJ86385.1 methionine--tRNA ligase [Burkholderia ubonensis]PAJ93395.1 methionine--tRNA ligase [Burkholderia ubonensis]PAK06390.1 methionine--tRNA ligase [Burkholderia ubonensis]PAK12174.1 methionine--tRNA ligase [Burkholderia ubonensis]RQP31431.1 methionine--tRNA ligase [Burkholderia ubonensis]
MRETLIIAPPPTPNGDLHVGHMAGPYLAADIFARYRRTGGMRVNYATGTDDSQTYVVTSAEKLDMTPASLCRQAASDIKASLEAWGVELDGYAPFDDEYKRMVRDFLVPLHAAGVFKLKTVRLPYSVVRQEFMVESYVSGDCPECLGATRGGLCESCGHPNNFDMLIDPRSTRAPFEQLEYREVDILVFPVEEYRSQLEAYYERVNGRWRPHIMHLMRELLSKPLIDFPITYPIAWGIKAPFPEVDGQVINAWAEGMAASMYCSHCGDDRRANIDSTWLREADAELVYFLGFDNSYFWGVTHLALLMAHRGKYILPTTIVPNEFYELEDSKFSTSRGHLIWARDLIKEVPRDYARFYLSLTCPENNRSSFSREGLVKAINERLVAPWNALIDAYAAFDPVPSLSRSENRDPSVEQMVLRRDTCFALDTFSLRAATDWITQNIARITRNLREQTYRTIDRANAEIAALVIGMAPIVIDHHARLISLGVYEQAKSGNARLSLAGMKPL